MLQFQPQEHLLHSYIVVSQSEQARERLALDLTAAMLCTLCGAAALSRGVLRLLDAIDGEKRG